MKGLFKITILLSFFLLTSGIKVRYPDLSEYSQYSLQFDGEQDYVVLPNDPLLDRMEDFTILFWFKADDTTAARQELISKDTLNPQSTGDWSCFLKKGKVQFENKIGRNPTISTRSKTSIVPGIWYYVSVTRQAITGRVILYLNGIKQGSYYGFQGPSINYQPLHIARHSMLDSLYFKGKMDELSIWPVILDMNEIQNYMRIPPDKYESDPIANWKMEKPKGSKCVDHAQNHIHGKIHGKPIWSDDVSWN